MSKRKILFFINSDVGGAERMSVLISKILIKAGLEIIYVIIKNKDNAASITEFLPSGHKVFFVKAKNHVEKLRLFYFAIRDFQPNVVFSSHYSINDKVLLFKPFFRDVRFVIRSDNYYYTYSRVGKIIIQMTYWLADVMIAQTKEMEDEYVENKVLPQKKICTLENPVDKEYVDALSLNSVSPYPNDGKKHIVAVGRFAYQKGYDYLIEAFAKLLNNRTDCELYIVGANTEKWKAEYVKVKSLIKEFGLEKTVHCVGYLNNPYPYVKHSDCFVLSSRWEGLPNVLAEALYLHVPTAAFKCIPIIERMVRNGVDGYLADKENVEDLADAIGKTLGLGRTNPVYSGADENDYLRLFI